MAPEQVLGQHVSPATDLYSLGLMAYTLLVGVSYWQPDAEQFENPIAFALHTTKGASESPIARAARLGRWLPPGFDAWFERATNLTPARRFQKASELVSALAALFGDTGGAWALTPPSALSPAVVHTGATAISGAMAIGTAPGTEFDRIGTSPGLPRKGTNARWLIGAAVLGVLVLAAVSVVRWHNSSLAAALPASATAPSVALATPPARAVPLVAPLPASDAAVPPAPANASASASASASDPILPPAPRARPNGAAPSIANKALPPHPAVGPKYTRD
jgi:serine/threonine-protein kinase